MKKSRTETEALARRPCPCPPASWHHGCSFRPIVRSSSDLDADSSHACPEAEAPVQTPRGAVVALTTWQHDGFLATLATSSGGYRRAWSETARHGLSESNDCAKFMWNRAGLSPHLSKTTLHNCPRRMPPVPSSLTLPEGLPAERCYVAGSQTPPCFLWVENLRNLRKAGLGDITWLFGISPLLN